DADAPTDPHELRAWGLIAARLGRRSYCKDFASAVWWGAAPWAGGRSSGGRGPKIAPTERAERGLAALLTSTQNADGRAAWEQSKERFLDAKDEVARIRRERQGMADALRPAIELEASFAQAQDDLAASTAELEQHEAARATAATRAAPLVIEQQAAKRRLEAAGPPPPGHTIARLSEPAKKKELARRAAEQEAALAHRYAEEALDEIRALQRQIEGAKTTAARAEFARDDARERLDARAEALAAATSAEGNASTEKGTFIVPDDAWEADQRTRDLRAPWSDEVWNRARTECFLAALDLHEATLLANGRDARRNLSVAIDLISGRVSGLTHDVVLAAWQTLFLLVPVISTTFASLPTMLSGLGQEDLGWLLIDEAGQAQPQQAAGAIWRCQRAVVVGDPHQIEPVSGLPTSLAEAIRERFEVPIECISPEASVQRLADAVMPWGGRRGEDDLWVGVPMNVHRRCEPVIFELVNAIAYGGRMVNATVPREAHPALRVETCWLDVPSGSGSEGHWIPAEGHRLDALLAHLGMNGYDFRQVFAVSPFREVAWQLRRRADDPRHRGMTGGTIHTIQGREADTVILVLGGDPTKPGARRWVSSTPNLLNVAASRARQRLYVIGDHDAWIDLPYFRQLGGLRRVAPPAARAGAR
ncbi:MAG: AAA domain-containing protein, partial [Solirubrobacteraceae bacterium]|nr:AAA domain-containing protein [Solirubrobacteraceae bacterium]